MNKTTLDFETASAVDLKKAGAYVYAESPTTEVICLSYSVDGAKPITLVNQTLKYWPGHPLALLIAEAISSNFGLFEAHAAGFEKSVWRLIMMPVYGWPDIPDKFWHCTQSVCAQKSLPLKLEKASLVLRLNEQKDMIGHKLTMSLSKPKRGYYDRSEATLTRVYQYCGQDVRTEVELGHRIGPLQASERNVWLLDQRINQRGVRLDLEFVSACEDVVDKAMRPLVAEFSAATGGLAPTQRDKVLQWVHGQGVAIPNLQKDTILAMLGIEAEDDGEDEDAWEDSSLAFADAPLFRLPDHVRRVLDIRRICGSASIKKLKAIRSCISSDGRVRGVVQYHGASTGRWSGRLFQPHNFPRPTLKLDEKIAPWEPIYNAIMTRDVDHIGMLYGDPIETIISGLRFCIIATEPERDLTVGDFKTIEARVLLAIAGQHDKVKLLADGGDIYIAMAEDIYKRKITKEHLKERQAGKGTVLGAGYQMGPPKFQLQLKKQYGVEVSMEESKQIITAYREEFAPEVPKLWAGLEEAARETAWERTPHEAFGVRYAIEDMWMTARLPSGRKLYYCNPRPERKAMPWSTEDKPDIRPAWSFEAQKSGRWRRVDAYGGLLTENVVSGLSRDLLAASMFKCEKENLPVVLTVHDENICEPLTRYSDKDKLHQIMCDRPQWAVDLQIPVDADCWSGGRYHK